MAIHFDEAHNGDLLSEFVITDDEINAVSK